MPFSKRTPSRSCMKPVVAFHCHLCPLAVLFVRRNPGSQVLPMLLSFHQHHVLPGSQFSPGCPGLLWLHLDQVPQGLLGYMSCMSTSRFVHHDYKMDKIEQAANNRKSQWQTATVVALHNFTCHLAFQSKPGSSFLIFQVLIGVFLM